MRPEPFLGIKTSGASREAIGQQPQWHWMATLLYCTRVHPEQTTLYRLVQLHAASLIARTETSIGAKLPR